MNIVTLVQENHGYRCDTICQTVLSLRPIATSAVYFWDPNRRAELLAGRELRRKIGLRLRGFWRWATGGAAAGYGARFNNRLEEVREFDRDEPLAAAAGEEEEEEPGGGLDYQLMEG